MFCTHNKKQRIWLLLHCWAVVLIYKMYKRGTHLTTQSSVPKKNLVDGCQYAFRKASRRTLDSTARSSTAFPPPREREEKWFPNRYQLRHRTIPRPHKTPSSNMKVTRVSSQQLLHHMHQQLPASCPVAPTFLMRMRKYWTLSSHPLRRLHQLHWGDQEMETAVSHASVLQSFLHIADLIPFRF